MSAPIFSTWPYIYPGPHLDEEGKIDVRVWYSVPISISDYSITYLVFPHGGQEDEIREVTVDPSNLWMG